MAGCVCGWTEGWAVKGQKESPEGDVTVKLRAWGTFHGFGF